LLVPALAADGAVVVAFTSITDAESGIKFTLVTGMIAAVAFNVVYIPASFVLGGVTGATVGADVGMMMVAQGLGALMNLFGLIFLSPVGYILGGAIGSVLNDE
jgi:hypothetical protein